MGKRGLGKLHARILLQIRDIFSYLVDCIIVPNCGQKCTLRMPCDVWADGLHVVIYLWYSMNRYIFICGVKYAKTTITSYKRKNFTIVSLAIKSNGVCCGMLMIVRTYLYLLVFIDEICNFISYKYLQLQERVFLLV